jgi:hypothetical protein
MSKIVSIEDAARRRGRREKAARADTTKGKTLCGRGFHKWEIDPRKQFDVRRGRLVTRRRCVRCGVERTTLE